MKKTPLTWENLKDDYCPKCYQEIEEKPESYYWKCTSCDFRISKTRHDEILEDIEKEEAGNNAENA